MIAPPPCPCPLCGQAGAAVFPGLRTALREGGRLFQYRDCARCGLLYCDPLPDDAELRHLYQERYDFDWFRQRRWLKQAQAWHRGRRLAVLWRRLGESSGAPRFLDIGCGHGWLVQAARGRGWQASGLDYLNAEQMARGQRLGLDLHSCALQDQPFAPGSFDLISLWHVLEHGNDPRAMLAQAAALLRPGGLLVLAVPNRASLGLARAGESWGWLQKPFIHPFGFSAAALHGFLPGSLEVAHTDSRDTWDQQLAQDTAPVRGLRRLAHRCGRALLKVLRRTGGRGAARRLDGLPVWLDEMVLVGCYGLYLAARRLPPVRAHYEQALRACELLLVCRRR